MMNSKLTKELRQKWLSVMKNEFMSSEESGDDDDSIVTRPLPWRTGYVDQMFSRLMTTARPEKVLKLLDRQK